MLAPEREEEDNFVYPSGLKFALLMTSIYITMFLVALVCIKSLFKA